MPLRLSILTILKFSVLNNSRNRLCKLTRLALGFRARRTGTHTPEVRSKYESGFGPPQGNFHRSERGPGSAGNKRFRLLVPSQNSRTKPLPPSNVSSGSPGLSTSRRVAIALCPKADSFSSRRDVSIQITWRGTRKRSVASPRRNRSRRGGEGGRRLMLSSAPVNRIRPFTLCSSSHHRFAIFLPSFARKPCSVAEFRTKPPLWLKNLCKLKNYQLLRKKKKILYEANMRMPWYSIRSGIFRSGKYLSIIWGKNGITSANWRVNSSRILSIWSIKR